VRSHPPHPSHPDGKWAGDEVGCAISLQISSMTSVPRLSDMVPATAIPVAVIGWADRMVRECRDIVNVPLFASLLLPIYSFIRFRPLSLPLAADVRRERPAGAAGRKPVIDLRQATWADLDGIVAAHTAAFPGFFLTELGAGFLRTYYRAVLDFDGGLMLVADMDGRVAGFVAGFADPRRFYAVFRRQPLTFAPAIVAGLLRRPWLVGRIVARIGSVLHRGRDQRDDRRAGNACELSSLAVDPRARRRGIGRKLVVAFVAEARERGLDVVRLTTDACGNDQVNAFYANLGFQLVSRDGAATRPMNEYELALRTGDLRHAG